jgi:hypothetical protein
MLHTPEIEAKLKQLDNFSPRHIITGLPDNEIKELWAQLSFIQPHVDGLDSSWQLWIRSSRGDISLFGDFEEWKECGEVDNYEEFVELWESYYPDEICWHKFTLVEYDQQLYIYLDSTNLIQYSLENGEMQGANSADFYKEILSWIINEVSAEIKKVVADVKSYNNFINDNLPYKHRYGKIKWHILWDNGLEYSNYREGLGENLIQRFEEVVKNNDENRTIDKLLLEDFLRYCEIGYDANNYFKGKQLTALEKYKSMADLRHGGMLDIDPSSAEEFHKWYHGRQWMGTHPWEICRGGNSTHISLMVTDRGKSWQLYLAGYLREIETVKMAIALYDNNIPFILEKKHELLAKVSGEGYVGIVPKSVMPKYCHSLFPKEDNINDFINPWSYPEDIEVIIKYSEWYRLDEVSIIRT